MVSSEVKPVVIGITGGIGTGKSTVTRYLVDKGFVVLDADKISHEITEKGSPALDKLADNFGREVILPDGNLDRKKVARIVFSNADSKKKLENIITSQVINIISTRIDELRKEKQYDIIFVDAPLLFESGADSLTNYNWIVVCDREIQIKRAMERDNLTREEIESRISNQMSAEEKIKRSDDIIDNSKGIEELYNQVELLINKYEK